MAVLLYIVMEIFIGVIVGLLMLMFLVTAHEFGHFIAARKNGVDVEEFGICFPPRAIAWRKVDGKWRKLKKKEWKNPPGKGLIISLNWLPIGGFCQMHGESDADNRKGSFGKATYWQKTKILFGGVAMNWLVAFVLFTVLAFMGMPHFLENQFVIDSDVEAVATTPVTISSVIEGSPAALGSLQEGDVVTKIQTIEGDDSVAVVVTDDLLDFNSAHTPRAMISFIHTIAVTSGERSSSCFVNEIPRSASPCFTVLGVPPISSLYIYKYRSLNGIPFFSKAN